MSGDEALKKQLRSHIEWILREPPIVSCTFWKSLDLCEKRLNQEIDTYLEERPTIPRRLGVFFEELLSLLFRASQPHEFLRGHRIRLSKDDGSLYDAEFDYLFFDEDEQSILHLEVAAKFYLKGREGKWLGPRRHDAFHKKMRHMSQVQSRRLLDKEAQVRLRSTLPESWRAFRSLRSEFLMHGVLFQRGSEQSPMSTDKMPVRGRWIRQSELARGELVGTSLLLEKPHWFSSFGASEISCEAMLDRSEPFLVASSEGDARVFVVPDDWDSLPYQE